MVCFLTCKHQTLLAKRTIRCVTGAEHNARKHDLRKITIKLSMLNNGQRWWRKPRETEREFPFCVLVWFGLIWDGRLPEEGSVGEWGEFGKHCLFYACLVVSYPRRPECRKGVWAFNRCFGREHVLSAGCEMSALWGL